MAIELSDIAALPACKISSPTAARASACRLGVKTTGCSGLAYVIEFVDELRDDDEVFETKGVKVVVDKQEPDVPGWHRS